MPTYKQTPSLCNLPYAHASALRARICPTRTAPSAPRARLHIQHTAMSSSSSSEEEDIVRRLERVHASCPSPIPGATLAGAPIPAAAASFSFPTPQSLFSHNAVSPRSRTPPHLQLGGGRRKHRAPTPSAADLLQKRVAQDAQQHARAIIVLQEPTTPTEEELEQMVSTLLQHNMACLSLSHCINSLTVALSLSLPLTVALSLSPLTVALSLSLMCCAGG